MYGALRFLYNNLVTADMITLSSMANGKVSGVKKVGTGVATLEVSGDYQGVEDLLYTVEIDSVAGGAEVGSATFKWRTSETAAGSYEETGALTRTSPVYPLSADGRGTGLSIAFTGGVGDDCVLEDYWKWIARSVYGPERLLDRNRMTCWRSTGDSSESIIINLGSAQDIYAFIIQDHNITSGATVKLQANTSDSWTTPAYSNTFTTISDPLFLYLDQEYQYWRVLVEDASNPDGYIEIGNLFLGSYLELEQANACWGSSATEGYNLQSNISEAGVFRRYAYGSQLSLALDFGELISNEDVDNFIALQTALVDASAKTVKPLWVHLFSDDADDFMYLMDWENLGAWTHSYFAYLLNSGVQMNLKEVAKV